MNRYYKPCEKGYNPYIDLSPYRDIVISSDSNIIVDSDSFKIAVVMLYGGYNKLFNASLLSWHCNVPQRLTVKAVRNLKLSKIWIQKGKKARHEFDTKWARSSKERNLRLTLALWLDACVAIGDVVKIGRKYGLSEWTKISYSRNLKKRLKITDQYLKLRAKNQTSNTNNRNKYLR